MNDEFTEELVIKDGISILHKKSKNLEKVNLDPILLAERKERQKNDNVFLLVTEEQYTSYKLASELAVNMRKYMGSPNMDLSKNVLTKETTINSDGYPLRIRIYHQSEKKQEAVPAFIFFHGGAFFGGEIEVVENFCKGIAQKANAVVLNVDYRLAPEFPAPTAVNDCYAAVKWVHTNALKLNIDPKKIAVGGDSAGGNLAAAVSWIDRAEGNYLIKMQALIYPTLCSNTKLFPKYEWPVERYQPIEEFKQELEMDLKSMYRIHEIIEIIYVKAGDSMHPTISPLLADDFSKTPPTLMAVAEFDFLRPFGEEYARKLEKAGRHVKCICYEGMKHSFIDRYGILPQGEDFVREITKMLHLIFN